MKIINIALSFVCFIFFAEANGQLPSFGWAKGIGGAFNDYGTSIVVDATGNVYTTGSFFGTVDFDPGVGTFNLVSAGLEDIFVSKLDAQGNFEWAVSLGGVANDRGNAITIDGSNNIYLTGYFDGTGDFDPGPGTYNLITVGNYDIFVVELSSSGNLLWAKSIGGTDFDFGTSIAVDLSGNVFTTGYYYGTSDFDPGIGTYNLNAAGIFISKLDTSGNFVWAKGIDGSTEDRGNSIVVDAAGNIYTTGCFYNGTRDFDPGAGEFNLNASGFDIFILKLDANGDFVWAKMMGGVVDNRGVSISLDGAGNIYTTGHFSDGDFDPGPAIFNLATHSGSNDIFILKLDQSGNFVWAKSMGGDAGNEEGRSIVIDDVGDVYTTGYFSGQSDFDPGLATYKLTSAGLLDIFISKLDASGNFVWAMDIGEALEDSGGDITLDANGNIYTTGSFKGTVDFDEGEPTFDLTSAGYADIFVHKMIQPITEVVESATMKNIRLYPNPTSGLLNASVSSPENNVSIEIYNGLGVLVCKQALGGACGVFELTQQPKGLYLVKTIFSDKTVSMQKIVKD